MIKIMSNCETKQKLNSKRFGWLCEFFKMYALTHSHSEFLSKRIVCFSHTFKNNSGIKQKFTKYSKEGFCLAYDQHFSFKYFPEK